MQIDLRDIPIIYMNMDEDLKRNRDMQVLFQDLSDWFNFDLTNIYRLPGKSRNPVKASGVAEAHLGAIEFSKRFEGPVLILEDDLELASMESPVLDIPEDSDAVYLGNMKYGLTFSHAYPDRESRGDHKKITANVIPNVYESNLEIYKVWSMTGGQSILYINDTYKTLTENSCKLAIMEGIPHDTYLAVVQRLANVYAFNTPMFINKTCRWDSTFRLEEAFYNQMPL